MNHLALSLALIGVIGIAAQWIAWRTRLPDIALLLVAGIVAGPLTATAPMPRHARWTRRAIRHSAMPPPPIR